MSPTNLGVVGCVLSCHIEPLAILVANWASASTITVPKTIGG
jgi:hypothetical protein